jgi:acyl-CoA reductase-like NAD-dependent aldehyde dehydrogenase
MSGRVGVRKTHKLFIGGAFPRSESGRTYPAIDADGDVIARMALASRKDLRDAIRIARGAQSSWAGRTGYNRGQILYRLAEMMEERSAVFVEQLQASGSSKRQADTELIAAVDRVVWYAGWCDKYAQVMGNLNPVSGPFFNISAPEPSGVVCSVADQQSALLGLVSVIVPPLVVGNTVVVVASESKPIPAVALCGAMATSDVPGGVVNVLTGSPNELLPWMAAHMDVDVLDLTGASSELVKDAEVAAADNMKRVVRFETFDGQSPYRIAEFAETKTVWHPKGV